VARLVDVSGIQYRSAPAKILVRGVDTIGFVRRTLPAGYIPGTAFVVTLGAQPPAATSAYALEDMPPKGWSVSNVSDGGAFDPITGKVKFGLFTDDTARTLTYTVAPPASATGSYRFSGSSSLSGKLIPIAGDSSIALSNGTHPADLNPADQAISLAELTAYGAAWKTGGSWSAGPVPIPLDYLTRAGQIWKNGEKYIYDPTQGAPPLCWVVFAPKPLMRVAVQGGGTAERVVQPSKQNPQAFTIQIKVSPGVSVTSFALLEQLPAGWTVTSVSDDGFFDAKANAIRWGLFLDSGARVLTYESLPGPSSAGASPRGWVSFDGSRDEVREQAAGSSGGAGYGSVQLGGISHGPDGAMRLNLHGPANAICTIQTSSDLEHWVNLVPVFLPDGQLQYPAQDTNAPIRFFRTR
jgi:hypothetical protein